MRTRQTNRARLNVESLEVRRNPRACLVDNFDADGPGSLADAVALVNASSDQDNTIDFSIETQEGDIYLTSELTVSKNVTITGPGTGAIQVSIHGTRGQLDPFVAGKRVFSVTEGAQLVIDNLAVTEGGTNADTDINGGLIKVDTNSTLRLHNSLLAFGRAKGDGGGIWVGSGGKLEVYGSTVENNDSLGNGGGIAIAGGAAVTIRSFPPEDANATWSNILWNTAGNDGGGVYITGSGNVTQPPAVDIRKTYITANDANGGFGGGASISWTGNTTANKPVQIQYTEVTGNYALFNGGGIHLGVGANTKFGAGVKVNENSSKQKDGIGVDARNANVEGRDRIEEKNNKFLPPPDDDGTPPSAMYLGAGNTFDFTGTLDMTADDPGGDGVVAVTFRSAGNVYLYGDATGPAAVFEGDVDITGGRVTVGRGTATAMEVTGNYTQNGDLALELGGGGPNLTGGVDYDQVRATGAGKQITLGGTLVLTTLPTFGPGVGDVFTIVSNQTGEPVAGTFAGLVEGGTYDYYGWVLRVSYGPDSGANDVTLTVVQTPPADSGGTIGSYVWEDTNNNGIQDFGEHGLGGVTVNLLDADGTVIRTAISDPYGHYSFQELGHGTYEIEFVLPVNYAFSPEHQGGSAYDSDADLTTGRTGTFALAVDQQMTDLDAGLFFAGGSGGSGGSGI